jgi:hypothetical protein
MKLVRRGLLRPEEISADGEVFTIIRLSPSDGSFYKYDLIVKGSKGGDNCSLGLQGQSLNMDALIDECGDDPDKWPGKKIRLATRPWNDKLTIRVFAAGSKPA